VVLQMISTNEKSLPNTDSVVCYSSKDKQNCFLVVYLDVKQDGGNKAVQLNASAYESDGLGKHISISSGDIEDYDEIPFSELPSDCQKLIIYDRQHYLQVA